MNTLATEDLPVIAVLEDDVAMRTMLQRILGRSYHILMANSAEDLLRMLREQRINLILLDILLPGENGIEIAKMLRATYETPVILVSGLSSAEVIATGLNVGADDYITKPFSPLVLQARVRNALRREPAAKASAPRLIHLEHCVANPLTRTIENAKGESVHLTEKEFQLFMALVRSATEAVPRDELSRLLTGHDWSPENRGLDVHISNLRKKLRQITGVQAILTSVRGIGYRLQSVAITESANE